MSTLKSIGKRILGSLPVLVGVILVIFLMLRILPGNAIVTMMGEHVNEANIARMTAELGLDQPWYVQFWVYLKGLFTGDMGTSLKYHKPVSDLIATYFPTTVRLAAYAAVVAWVVGIFCGVISAVRKDKLVDRLFMGFSLLGVSVPVFMTAMVLQYFFAYQLKWFPLQGTTQGFLSYVLPAIALGWNSAGSVARLTRSTLLEVMQSDYIDTARAKGRGVAGSVLFHALRNAMIPVITVMAMQISSLLSGAVITETIFSLPGIGRLCIDAISGRDVPLLQGSVIFTTLLVIGGNLVADCLYAALDPRIRKEA
ncbi:MAG: ABC transporter permease [Oscillospiraceae bacterium]|jgi:peptide/nickel transport system permease protein|nr:ABC transporter permease [Oscillospiraceae bacterium]